MKLNSRLFVFRPWWESQEKIIVKGILIAHHRDYISGKLYTFYRNNAFLLFLSSSASLLLLLVLLLTTPLIGATNLIKYNLFRIYLQKF